ncbi:MAG: UDP-N-acetylmuramoyl-L-alanine--D-glutamate ligase [Rhodobacteraceae bacterium]|nr:UDP-N-acetylmuramoyl-L-alanine--D-glutamate ligase [Paracoccaceae bacterium]
MIPVRGYRDRPVAILGLGRSGLATARAVRAGGALPVCWDDNPAVRATAAAEGLPVADLSKPAPWAGVSCLVLSPGIPHLYPEPHPIVRMAWDMGTVVDNDIGLFFRSYGTPDWEHFDVEPRVIAITGSNGKSTTTALINHILSEAGRKVQMGGNIGKAVLGLNPAESGQITVLELSSYQIDLARALSPDVAVFLNLAADHLDRHGGQGGYFAAKARLFTAGVPDRSVIGVDEPEGAFLANRIREMADTGDPVIRIAGRRTLSGDGWYVQARKGWISEWRKGRQVMSLDLRAMRGLPGPHNHQNACAAWAVCRSLGLAPRQIEAHLTTYGGLPHRCRIVAEKHGVTFVNDSKATNADAAEKALMAFSNIHWIVGGQAKDGGIVSLAPHFDRVKKAYLIGAAAADFAGQLAGVPHTDAHTIEEAVALAAAEAVPGDVVLLAPAAASFDQFTDFAQRGAAFEAAVRRVP